MNRIPVTHLPQYEARIVEQDPTYAIVRVYESELEEVPIPAGHNHPVLCLNGGMPYNWVGCSVTPDSVMKELILTPTSER
jgi:hypothetical protein